MERCQAAVPGAILFLTCTLWLLSATCCIDCLANAVCFCLGVLGKGWESCVGGGSHRPFLLGIANIGCWLCARARFCSDTCSVNFRRPVVTGIYLCHVSILGNNLSVLPRIDAVDGRRRHAVSRDGRPSRASACCFYRLFLRHCPLVLGICRYAGQKRPDTHCRTRTGAIGCTCVQSRCERLFHLLFVEFVVPQITRGWRKD